MNKLIATKLLIPPTRPGLVSRTRLVDRLNSFLYPGSKLILVTAPAGYGKTTLVADWLNQMQDQPQTTGIQEIKAAWFSVDESDNDPVRFHSYFTGALNNIEGVETHSVGDSFGLLKSIKLSPLDLALIPAINSIASLPDNIIIVLDDYHLIENELIHNTLSRIIENIPPQMHLVIVSREDPQLPLSRLRSRGQMSELRAADLKFRTAEAEQYLNQIMGLDLPLHSISSLENRTEGWIAGLQLAALSMRGSQNTSRLIKAFTGSHRLVQDFLIDEVLSLQPDHIQNFLLQTSVLDRLTGPICEYLTGQTESISTLEYLDRANLFIVPLDDQRISYRYHHLFADLLRLHLHQKRPDQVSVLHSRASQWYEEQGQVDEAVSHALRAHDFKRAIDLIEDNIDDIWGNGEYTKLNNWLKGLPEEKVLARPQLCIFRAWELYASGQPYAGERLLQEAGLASDFKYEDGSVDKSIYEEAQISPSGEIIQGRAAALQAWMAAWRRDNISGLLQHLKRALSHLPTDDPHWRGAVAITLADAYAFQGDLTEAYYARLEALKDCQAAGNTYLYLYNSAKLALNLRLRGKLLKALNLCQERVEYAAKFGMEGSAPVGWLLAVWADTLAEIGSLDAAKDRAERSYKLTKPSQDAGMQGWSLLTLVRVHFSRREYLEAEQAIKELDRISRRTALPTWITYQKDAWLSRIWLAQGKQETAAQWAQERSLTTDQASDNFDAFNKIAIARVQITLGETEDLAQVLEILINSSRSGENLTRLIELLILQALARTAAGENDQALVALEQALGLAEEYGFFQVFLDEGQPLASLLYTALDQGLSSPYLSRLLEVVLADRSWQLNREEQAGGKTTQIETLSKREIEILTLMAAGLTNPDIAAKLILSLHTVKAHARNIYRKLDASSRMEAVTKARTLGILLDI